jgi:hypothetical protein
MPHRIKGWGGFIAAQAVLTFVWHMLEKLAEHAMLTWSDDQIAKFLGLSSPEASTVISWAIPAFLGFVTLLLVYQTGRRWQPAPKSMALVPNQTWARGRLEI